MENPWHVHCHALKLTPVKSVDVKKDQQKVKKENKTTILSYFSSSPSTTATDSVLETSTFTKTSPFNKTSSSQHGKQDSSDFRSSEKPVKRVNTNEVKSMEEEHLSPKLGRWEAIEEDNDDIQLLNPLPKSQNLVSHFIDDEYDSKDTSNSPSDGIVDVSDSDSVIVISDSDEEPDNTPKPTFSNKMTDENSLLETIFPPWQSQRM
ncbi:unnamed protein product, partial [Candidula unifasciata]